MKRTTPGARRSLRRLLSWVLRLLGLTWATCTLTSVEVSAQELVVVLSSPEDEASADKLAELTHEPFERVDAASASALPPAAAGGCRTRARLELSLDSVGQSVRLQRCRDATLLARALDPEAVRKTPYLGAFVAAELLAINRELEAAESRSARAELERVVPPAPPPAAPSGSVPAPAAPAPLPPPSWHSALSLRVGAELTLWGAPFDSTIRPSFGLGLSVRPDAARLTWWMELGAGLFAVAEETRPSESLSLTRHDGELLGGVQLPLGPLRLSGFALLRASFTRWQYSSGLSSDDSALRLGVGLGVRAEVPLSRSFALYAQGKLDVATSRSEYRIARQPWVSDPASLLWFGIGLMLRLPL
jgi:hypothetical protein